MSGYKIGEQLLLQRVADETVILDPVSGNYFTLDAIGTRMVELLRELKTVDAAVVVLAQEYAALPSNIEADMRALLDQMVQSGLVAKTAS
ncbi:MAG: Uncharacterized protein FD130_727 [Halothiobacillaceae bacterium]|nr:MAG: Uncharacterized protein FD130_727 [Halothiobacillaceae bacterium]